MLNEQITPGMRDILDQLEENGPMAPSQLARGIDKTPANTLSYLERMRGRGLITKIFEGVYGTAEQGRAIREALEKLKGE